MLLRESTTGAILEGVAGDVLTWDPLTQGWKPAPGGGGGPPGPPGPPGPAGAQNVTRVTILGGGGFTDAGAPLLVAGPSHTSLTGNVLIWAQLECAWAAAPAPLSQGTILYNFAAPAAPSAAPNVVWRVDALGAFLPSLPFVTSHAFADGVGFAPVGYALNVSSIGAPPVGNTWTVNGVTWIIMDTAP